MTKEKPDIEQLKHMQQDAVKRRSQRNQRHATDTPESETQEKADENQQASQAKTAPVSTDEESAMDLEESVQHYADQLAGAVKQLEEAAREHPALALIAAFTTGVVIGNLFSRK
jgi:ElaB/YqjD/DUF883 family membrane-anchored ribosome-binding protein